MSWLNIVESEPPRSGITRLWSVRAKRGGADLGLIAWYVGWRKYCFYPSPGAGFEEDCLREIADFCERQTREHKQKRQQSALKEPS